MIATADAPALSELSEDQLASLYDSLSYDPQARAIIAAEGDRRDRNERARAEALHARRADPVVAEWSDAALAQFRQAEAECQGNLVRRGIEITDPFSLWSGPEWLARRRATEELCNFWDVHPRIPTVTEWREHDREDIPPEDTTEGATMIDARRETATDQPSLVAKYQQMGAKHAVTLREQSAVVRQREAVDGAQTLEYARRFLAHFAVWPSEAALTVATLWAAHAHARDAKKALVFLSTPRLLFSSAEPGSGKSHAMKLVSRLCPDPAVFVEPSEPALAQSIGTEKATIFLDEVDEFFTGRRKGACKAIVNDGAYPEGFWPRVRNGVTMRVPTFGALSMAGLDKVETAASGSMAATLSRCIRIRMRRAAEDYRAPRFDHKARFAAQVISERLGAWATQELDQIATYVPEMDGIGNRLADLYEPLYIIADIAGGPWPEMVRDAAAELIASGDMPPEDEEKAAKLEEIMTAWTAESDTFTNED